MIITALNKLLMSHLIVQLLEKKPTKMDYILMVDIIFANSDLLKWHCQLLHIDTLKLEKMW